MRIAPEGHMIVGIRELDAQGPGHEGAREEIGGIQE
jgi:hypothetical protein